MWPRRVVAERPTRRIAAYLYGDGALAGKRQSIDLITLAESLERQGQLDSVGGFALSGGSCLKHAKRRTSVLCGHWRGTRRGPAI